MSNSAVQMSKLVINSTYAMPQVVFDPEKGVFKIEGRLIPDDTKTADDFFVKIISWLDNYPPGKNTPIIIRMRLHHYNTIASKRLFGLLRKFEELSRNGSDLKIVWEYEDGDEDAMYNGEHYKSVLSVPFEVVEAHLLG